VDGDDNMDKDFRQTISFINHALGYWSLFQIRFHKIGTYWKESLMVQLKLIGPSKALTGCNNSMFMPHISQCNDFHSKGFIQVLPCAHGTM
jgi:hypothetical protein